MRPTRATERSIGRTSGSNVVLAILLLGTTLTASACLWVTWPAAPTPEVPTVGFDAGKYQVQKLTAALAQRDRALDSMQTPAVMEYTAGNQHLKAKEQIIVRRPNNMRVEAMSPFGVAMVLAARNGELAIFEPQDNRFIRGRADAGTLFKYVRIPMAPADAVGLLMGLAPRDFLTTQPADSVSNDGAMTIAVYGQPGTGLRQLGFTDGRLAMVRETESDSRVRYEVRYSDYHDIGGVMFPYVVDAQFPIARSHVTFRYLRPIINGDVPASTFVLIPAPGAAMMDLSLVLPALVDIHA